MEMFYGLSTDPEYLGQNVNLYIGLSPHTVFRHPNVFVKNQAQLLTVINPLLKVLHIFEVAPQYPLETILENVCGYFTGVCQFIFHYTVTSDTTPIDYDTFRAYFGHYPSGSGINCLIHYYQMHAADKF